MTKRTNATLILICVVTVACGRDREKAAPATTPATPPQETTQTDPNHVRVDATMLRDLRLTTAPVESRRSGEDVVLLGELTVDERAYAEVGAPVPARVVRLLAGPGDAVRQGQVLLELQSPDLGKARADYVSAQARLTLAEGVLKRKRELAAERIAPVREVQEAEAAAAEARASLRSAAAALGAYGVSLPQSEGEAADSSTFSVRSPVAGTVIERTVMLGQMLDPARPAFRIANMTTLWLTVHAFERDAVRIATGASAKLSFPALPGDQFRGVVTLVGREVAHESRTVPIRVEVRNPGAKLRPGMSATAAVPVGASEAMMLTVPVAAVQRVRNEWCVFVPKDASVYEIRKIGRGRDLGTEVEVLSGLSAGDVIVVDGAFLLKSQAEKSEAGHGGHGGRP